MAEIRESELAGELADVIQFSFSRSSGSGGQNVNKVNTRVRASLSIEDCVFLTSRQKARVCKKLASRINKSGELAVQVEDERSQFANRQKAVARLTRLIVSALRVEKKRLATKPTKAGIARRLGKKKAVSLKKRLRKAGPEE